MYFPNLNSLHYFVSPCFAPESLKKLLSESGEVRYMLSLQKCMKYIFPSCPINTLNTLFLSFHVSHDLSVFIIYYIKAIMVCESLSSMTLNAGSVFPCISNDIFKAVFVH